MNFFHKQLLEVFSYMVSARRVDEMEESYTQRGLAHFQVSGKGHEGSAILSLLLIQDDWLHCHYRDKALMLARGISEEKFFDGLFNNSASCSKGRQMSAHLSDRATNIMSIVGPVGNHALQAVGVAHEIKGYDSHPLVLCSMGEGTTQEGEVYEALAEAVRSQLPVLFFIEDNQYAISTDTRSKTFYSTPYGERDEYCGIEVIRVDGWDVVSAFDTLRRAVDFIRKNRKPQIVVFNVKRLSDHTNADNQTVYKPKACVAEEKAIFDPVENLERYLINAGFEQDVLKLKHSAESRVKQAAKSALNKKMPKVSLQSKRPFDSSESALAGSFPAIDFLKYKTIRESIKSVLRFQLTHNPNVLLYGEDIEDPKGDVFGVTKGLSEAFPGRVLNSALSESTIIGVSIGRSLAGARPVAFIQFADFLPLAFNQIVSELATMYWRTDGEWESPVIIMVSCGAYRPGLGPYHANTYESLFAHIPGLDVMMPSSSFDAAELLTTAFESQRPTLFFYPKSILNVENHLSELEGFYAKLPYGKARQLHRGNLVTVVSWGSTVPVCQEVVRAFADKGVLCDLYDLRFVSPWDSESVIESAKRTGRLLVCHEDNSTCGMAAEVIATVTETLSSPIRVKRVTRPDVFIPCNYDNQIELMPSYHSLVEAIAGLIEGQIEWQREIETYYDNGTATLDALGASPSDETVTVLEYYVQREQAFDEGEPLVIVETNKAVTDICAHESGTVLELLVAVGETVSVGTPLIQYLFDNQEEAPPPLKKCEMKAKDFILNIDKMEMLQPISALSKEHLLPGIVSITMDIGSLAIPNSRIIKSIDSISEKAIFKLTGIKSRRWVSDDQSVLSMAVNAVRQLLIQTNYVLSDIDILIVATATPEEITPSIATSVLAELSLEFGSSDMGAFDINAACSGYLYGLEIANNFLKNYPNRRAILVTTEVLSKKLNNQDKGSYPIFADSATATLISGYKTGDCMKALLQDVYIGSSPDLKRSLVVPSKDMGYLYMNGKEAFSEAIVAMSQSLEKICRSQKIILSDLKLIVPHQASQKIIDSLSKRLSKLSIPVYSNISEIGNTSSSSIPIALSELFEKKEVEGKVGLCAFGGGFTYGAALIDIVKNK